MLIASLIIFLCMLIASPINSLSMLIACRLRMDCG
jgi:hypothetical protein